jgi:hypothetical protein
MLSILYWRMFMVNTYYKFNFQIIDHPSMQQYKGLTKIYNQSPIRDSFWLMKITLPGILCLPFYKFLLSS